MPRQVEKVGLGGKAASEPGDRRGYHHPLSLDLLGQFNFFKWALVLGFWFFLLPSHRRFKNTCAREFT